MNVLAYFRESWRNLAASKLRSFLALLGILVGTASVVALVSSSELATDHALAQFKSLGTNILAVSIAENYSNKTQQKLSFTLENSQQLQKQTPAISHLAPYVTSYKQMFYAGKSLYGSILGVTQDFANVTHSYIATGRFISNLDHTNLFCVIGNDLANKIHQQSGKPALGALISAGDQVYTVVGTLKKWPSNMFIFADINNSVLIPIQLATVLDENAKIDNIIFRLKPKTNLQQTQNKIGAFIKKVLPDDHIYFRNPEQIIKIMRKQHSTFTLLLGMIGGIALLVGGIGVMNIMLVSVVERKREIGIRLAIGAKRRDIRRMFLIEGTTLTLLGGILGISIGTIITFILAHSSGWEYHFFPLPAILGFTVSVLVGIASTIYPAYRASLSDPVVCLSQD